MVLIIGIAIFFIIILIKSVCILKDDKIDKHEDYRVKELYNDKDIPLSEALDDFKIIQTK